MTYRRIVVGTDGSDSANRAVSHAGWLAATLGADLYVSHAYAEPPEERGAARHVGASLLRDACGRVDGVRPSPILREGDPVDVLLELAGEEPESLIVVGNRGVGRRRVVLGAVPGKVAHRAPSDVLIAHTTGGVAERGYRRALLATDGSPTAERAVAAGRALAKALGAEAHEVRIDTGDPAEGIVREAQESGSDLVVLGNRGMQGARRFIGSVPSKVARRVGSHVLLVKTV